MKKLMGRLMAVAGLALVLVSPVFAATGVWIDVRSPDEYADKHLGGAINIPHTQISAVVSRIIPDKNEVIYLYCKSGRRAGIAQAELELAGYRSVTNVGGLNDAISRSAQQ